MQQAVLGSSTSQEISCIHYSVHITRILTTVPSRMNPIHHTFPPYFLEIHTIFHKFNLVSEFDGINQKAAQLISQLVDSNTSTFMPNPINMSHISVHSASRQAPWIFSMLDRYHSISGLWRTIKYYSLPHCFLSESKCSHLKGFCTNSANTKTALDATHGHTSQQCMPQLWNQQQPCRFYSTATYIMSSLLTAVVVVGRVWQVTA